MTSKKFTNKKEYKKALSAVYDFHQQVFNTIVALLKKKGDIEVKEPITFCFLDVKDYYTINAIRLSENKDDFYLEATSTSGNKRTFDWGDINYDMVITEWLMGFKWNDTYPEYDY